MKVAILLPSGVTAFEALGPYGVFGRLPDTDVVLLGDRAGRVPSHGTKVPLVAHTSYLFVEPAGVADVLVVPGGLGIRGLVADQSVRNWVRAAHTTAVWTIGISTGSVLLSAAGVLEGRDATTHWLAEDLLEQQGARAVTERIVRAGRVVTAAGAVAGLEAALFVVARLRGEPEAAAISDELGDAMAGVLTTNKPVATEVMCELAGVDREAVGPGPFGAAPTGRRRRRLRADPRRGWSPRSGRIRTTDPSRR